MQFAGQQYIYFVDEETESAFNPSHVARKGQSWVPNLVCSRLDLFVCFFSLTDLELLRNTEPISFIAKYTELSTMPGTGWVFSKYYVSAKVIAV